MFSNKTVFLSQLSYNRPQEQHIILTSLLTLQNKSLNYSSLCRTASKRNRTVFRTLKFFLLRNVMRR